jgi:LmbE family N-acetylglucosaminyl deacetylase
MTFLRLVPVLFFLCSLPLSAQGSLPGGVSSSDILLRLEKLSVLGSVLYIGAHPDDENTAVLAYCANEKKWRTAYLSLTRGDGGQNLIGSEQAEALGVLRTQELLAARALDGAGQYFTRAVDFGYSKSADETFRTWNREDILADVVRIIRRFRPDIVITRFPTTGEGGHGHHTASALLAEEAFFLAGDSAAFPDQLVTLDPWRPRRLYWNAWRPLLIERDIDTTKLPRINTGLFNPLLGMSYTEISSRSRTMHKSQGFGATPLRSTTYEYFQEIAGDGTSQDLFSGIDVSWQRVSGGDRVEKLLKRARETFDPRDPSLIVPILIKANREMAALAPNPWIDVKRKDIEDLISDCLGLWMEAISEESYVSPGQKLRVSAGVVCRTPYAILLRQVQWRMSGRATIVGSTVPSSLKQGIWNRVDTSLAIPADFPYSQPYWLANENNGGTYTVADTFLIGQPENESPLSAVFRFEVDGIEFQRSVPVRYRWNDRIRGESYRPLVVGPPVTIEAESPTCIFGDGSGKRIRLAVRSQGTARKGQIVLETSGGWKIEPVAIEYDLTGKGAEQQIECTVTPPEGASTSSLDVRLADGIAEPALGVVTVSHAHIPTQTYFSKTRVRLVRIETARTVASIGYVMGSGDRVPEYLRQLGYHVTLLSDDDLKGDLGTYDAIVTGIRAYNARPGLRALQPQLLEYVHDGGTLIVQYNVGWEIASMANLGPFPFRVSNVRVAEENAPVTFAGTGHPVLSGPNRLNASDFAGWIQERGLYFADAPDSSYEMPLWMADSGEKPSGGSLLFARYGRGVYIYTGLAFFRQLPAGVPGAFRLFVNLVSAGRHAAK